MQASSPTWVCGATRLRFPGWSHTLPLTVGAGSISARRRLRRRRVRRDEGIPPYGRLGGYGRPVWRVVFGRFVGEGFIPPGDLPVQQGSRDDASIVPYMGLRCDKVAVSRLVVYPTIDRRGGFHIRPRVFVPQWGPAG